MTPFLWGQSPDSNTPPLLTRWRSPTSAVPSARVISARESRPQKHHDEHRSAGLMSSTWRLGAASLSLGSLPQERYRYMPRHDNDNADSFRAQSPVSALHGQGFLLGGALFRVLVFLASRSLRANPRPIRSGSPHCQVPSIYLDTRVRGPTASPPANSSSKSGPSPCRLMLIFLALGGTISLRFSSSRLAWFKLSSIASYRCSFRRLIRSGHIASTFPCLQS